MRLRLIRHATLTVEFQGRLLLVDPMLDEARTRPPVQNSPNPRNNPLAGLPVPAEQLLLGIEAVLVTHTHSDHWDDTAARLIPKDTPLFCQPEDEAKFQSQGFTQVRAVRQTMIWNEIEIIRTQGRHGTGELAKRMGPVCGFVLRPAAERLRQEPTLYVAGDTVWCLEVEDALAEFGPQVTVVNAGGARFLEGNPITMTAADVTRVCRHTPRMQVVAVHMEAINHCVLTRAELAARLEDAKLRQQVVIPEDGEWIDFGA